MDLDQAHQLALRSNLEAILTLPSGFGLVTATPLQRAICRVATGAPLGELANHPDVIEAIGDTSLLWGEQPDELYLLAPARTGKSTIIAALAIRATQTVDLSIVGSDKLAPRYSILSLDVDKARAVYGHVKGALEGPFRHLLIREPTNFEAWVRHPSGRPVEIKVVAGKAGGAAVVSRWSVGISFDEAPRMDGADDKVVNLPDTMTAGRDRLLPGAQMVMAGSKWQPYGPVYDAAEEHGGRPCKAKSIVVIGAEGAQAPKLFPRYWTAARCDKLKAKDLDAYRVSVENKWLGEAENMFTLDELKAVSRRSHDPLEPKPLHHYIAVIDPATRSNAWTLVMLTKEARRIGKLNTWLMRVVLAKQWQGSSVAPLSPREVFGEIAELLEPYRCTTVTSDQWSADSNRDIARSVGLLLLIRNWTQAEQYQAFLAILNGIRERLCPDEGSVLLELHPALVGDLQRVKKVPTPAGVKAVLPRTSDGRHCDFAAALALSTMVHCPVPDERPVLPKGWAQWELDEAERYAAELRRARGEEDDSDEIEYEELEYE